MSYDNAAIDRAVAIHDDDKHALREHLAEVNWPLIVGRGVLRDQALEAAEQHEKAIIAEILRAQKAGGKPNISKVAEQSNVSRSTLIRKLAR